MATFNALNYEDLAVIRPVLLAPLCGAIVVYREGLTFVCSDDVTKSWCDSRPNSDFGEGTHDAAGLNTSDSLLKAIAAQSQTLDIGEKLDPLDVVFYQDELSQPTVIAVKGCVFSWWHEGRLLTSTRNHFCHTF